MSSAAHPLREKKSTTVRSSLLPAVASVAFRAADALAPRAAAWLADRLFFTPPPSARRRARTRRTDGVPLRVPVEVSGRTVSVAARVWGSGRPVVLLHGWGGRGSQLAAFVDPLVAAGFSVIALDAPGHGESGGRQSSIPAFAAALAAMARVRGPLAGVVAHSLGASATAFAVARGLVVPRAVFVGAPSDPPAWARAFARRFSLSARVVRLWRERAERRLGFRWDELDVAAAGRGRQVPLLVVHDREDHDVAWEEGARIAEAWPGARLLTTTGLGHRAILRDASVVRAAVAFLSGGSEPRQVRCATADCRRAPGASGLCDPCRLEAELFDRDLRPHAGAAAALSPAAP